MEKVNWRFELGQVFSLVWIVLLFGVFYILVIRPQQLRMRQRQDLVASLRAGDRVETIGGIQGVVMSLDAETLELQVAPEVSITIARRAVAARVGDED
ncbi:MAG: preprotein translocase subunit YajC [Actinomycetota bacterium]|nr:preprotein translocase subunit YajC [Actinomycetota bacterium]